MRSVQTKKSKQTESVARSEYFKVHIYVVNSLNCHMWTYHTVQSTHTANKFTHRMERRRTRVYNNTRNTIWSTAADYCQYCVLKPLNESNRVCVSLKHSNSPAVSRKPPSKSVDTAEMRNAMTAKTVHLHTPHRNRIISCIFTCERVCIIFRRWPCVQLPLRETNNHHIHARTRNMHEHVSDVYTTTTTTTRFNVYVCTYLWRNEWCKERMRKTNERTKKSRIK